MSEESQVNQVVENKPSDKELNFRKLEERYERQLAQERAERERLAKELENSRNQRQEKEEEEDDSDPYVDHKKLNKTLSKFGQNTQSEISKAMETAKERAKEELKQEMWLESNPDFYDVLNHAEKFAMKSPELAKSILKMPDGFERQKLVYQNIKALGIHLPEEKKSNIQDKIDANRRSPYYQPPGVATAPYSQSADFSTEGQKKAYEKMKQLKSNLRLG